jgi:hypothetical protein
LIDPEKFYFFSFKKLTMKRISLSICAIFLLTTIDLSAQTADEMKAYQEFMTPGPMHKWMAKFNGTWEGDITSFMDPANPNKSKATNVATTIMNGLYQTADMTGNIMGMPFQGHSIMAYDNGKKMFINTWIDNMGSGIIIMTGTYNESTKTLHLKGKQTNPMDGKDADIRQEMKIIDDNNYTLVMYGAGPGGQEMKFMEGTFKRKK